MTSDDDKPETPRPSAWLTPARDNAFAGETEASGTPGEPTTGDSDAAPEPTVADDQPGGDEQPAVDDEPTVRRPLPDLVGDTVRLRATPVVAAGEAATADEGSRHEGPAAEVPDGDAAGSLEPVIQGRGEGPGDLGDAVAVPGKEAPKPEKSRKVSSAGALIAVLLALFGFTLVVQLRSNDADQGLATARQEDLVAILSDLESRDTRLSAEISTLEQSQRQLTSGVAGRQAALAEADKRADELGLLAGTLPGRGPGLKIVIDPRGAQVKASAVLNAVQELRGAGGEVMEVVGADDTAVRIVASTYFIDAGAGVITVDGARVAGPYTLWVIGQPQTMQTALQIPGGVVASVESAGGSVTMEQSSLVEVAAVRKATDLQYARPVS